MSEKMEREASLYFERLAIRAEESDDARYRTPSVLTLYALLAQAHGAPAFAPAMALYGARKISLA